MPIVTVTLRKPKSAEFKTRLLDAIQASLVDIGANPDDRFHRVLELDEPITEGPTLLSDNAAASTRERLASLSALRQRSETQTADPGALEAVVRDMLKPMLKEWLDQRLPEIVEELVTREIARLTGRDI